MNDLKLDLCDISKISLQLPEDVMKILQTLRENGYEGYVVGGCIRDSLLELKPNDWDITTNATPEEIKKCFKDIMVIGKGENFGTVSVVEKNNIYELTTYRNDGVYENNKTPNEVMFIKDLKDDLAKRDFTINAIAYNPEIGIVDPFNGIESIKNKEIKCVGDPNKRFNEDALRILRSVRFSSVLNFDIEKETKNAMINNLERLDSISEEKKQKELNKILVGINVENAIKNNDKVIFKLIPELEKTKGFQQNNPYHKYDVFNHSIKTVKNTPPISSLRLAALLHDIEKPNCYVEDKNNTGHFYGHSGKSAEKAEYIMTRLKYSNEIKEKVFKLIYNHDKDIIDNTKHVKRYLNIFEKPLFDDLLILKKADSLAQNLELSQKNINTIDNIKKIEKEILKEKECFKIKHLVINGNDLIRLGYKQNEKLGEELQKLLSKVIEEEIPNEKDFLLKEAKSDLKLDIAMDLIEIEQENAKKKKKEQEKGIFQR